MFEFTPKWMLVYAGSVVYINSTRGLVFVSYIENLINQERSAGIYSVENTVFWYTNDAGV